MLSLLLFPRVIAFDRERPNGDDYATMTEDRKRKRKGEGERTRATTQRLGISVRCELPIANYYNLGSRARTRVLERYYFVS